MSPFSEISPASTSTSVPSARAAIAPTEPLAWEASVTEAFNGRLDMILWITEYDGVAFEGDEPDKADRQVWGDWWRKYARGRSAILDPSALNEWYLLVIHSPEFRTLSPNAPLLQVFSVVKALVNRFYQTSVATQVYPQPGNVFYAKLGRSPLLLSRLSVPSIQINAPVDKPISSLGFPSVSKPCTFSLSDDFNRKEQWLVKSCVFVALR